MRDKVLITDRISSKNIMITSVLNMNIAMLLFNHFNLLLSFFYYIINLTIDFYNYFFNVILVV
ncbi:hypothetical protein [Staphylococcus phage vB_ScaM-V1SC04]|nr:hypothetical protein [Staphylococcus phage vB_ScaM-V1SC04]